MSQRTDRRPSARQSLPLPTELARHRVELARWALAHGESVDLDAATVILYASSSASGKGGAFRWTRHDVAQLLWTRAAEVCEQHGSDLPAGTSETLWTVLTHLDATGRLRGDSLAELRAELTTSAGLDRRGRLRHPSGGRRSSAEVRQLRRRPA